MKFFGFILVFLFLVCPAEAQEYGARLTPLEVERSQDEKEILAAPYSGLLLTPRELRPVADEKYNQKYPTVVFVYAGEKSGEQITGYTRRFTVHAPDKQTLPTAKRVAKLLLWFQGMTRERLKTDHARNLPTVHVWLTRSAGAGLSGDVGGEQFKNHIYLYDIFAERKPIEWVRETAHEYGHYALPGVFGFTKPEEWSNGVLGERLYLKWLAEDIQNGRIAADALPFITKAELDDFQARQVVPLVSRWTTENPDLKRLNRSDAGGMDDYTAFVLAWDSVYGSEGVRQLFASTNSSAGNGFLTASDVGQGALDSLKNAAQYTIMPPLKNKAVPFFAYFPFGAWSIEAQNAKAWQMLTEGKNQITRNIQNKSEIFVKVRGWYKVILTPNSDTKPPKLTIKRIYTQ